MANYTPTEIRTKLSGPVFPIPTPFNEGGNVNTKALKNYIKFLVDCGAKTIMTTVGTSRFNLLSNDEIFQVNEIVCSSVPSQVITIAAGPITGSLQSNIQFARHAEAVGFDSYIACYPERWYGNEAVFNFFEKLSESVSIGVMIHEQAMKNGYGGQIQYPLDLLEQLVSIPNLVGMKEECMDASYAYLIHRRLQGKCAIIGAGAMRNFMRDFHAGAQANLVGIGSFFPKVEMAFQDALKSGNVAQAHHIVRSYEDPYFDTAVKLGWHPQLKEVMNIFNLMPAFEREPLPRLNDKQQTQLKECLEKLGWLNLSPDHTPE